MPSLMAAFTLNFLNMICIVTDQFGDDAMQMHNLSEAGFARFPEVGFARLPQVLAVFPTSRSSWWAGVKSGRYPKPVKLGPRTTAWKVEDIRALIEKLGETA
jgi:prophage regulatory protein